MPDKKEPEIIKVDPQDPTKKNSPIMKKESMTDEKVLCYWNGAAYTTGAITCSAGTRLRCMDNGAWADYGRC